MLQQVDATGASALIWTLEGFSLSGTECKSSLCDGNPTSCCMTLISLILSLVNVIIFVAAVQRSSRLAEALLWSW
jgi:hypothetical protein